MHNYYISYNLFKGNKRIASGNCFANTNNKILTNEDVEELEQNIEKDCEKFNKQFTYLHIISLNYLGEVE